VLVIAAYPLAARKMCAAIYHITTFLNAMNSVEDWLKATFMYKVHGGRLMPVATCVRDWWKVSFS
jgi:hypothetical protein